MEEQEGEQREVHGSGISLFMEKTVGLSISFIFKILLNKRKRGV